MMLRLAFPPAVISTVTVIAALVVTPPARAADGGVPLGKEDLSLSVARMDATGTVPLTADEVRSYFGTTRCACPTNVLVSLALGEDAAAKLGSDTLEATLMVGNDCAAAAAVSCDTLGPTLTLGAGKAMSAQTISSVAVFAGVGGSAACASFPRTATRLWAVVRQNGEKLGSHPSLAIDVGGRPPPPPTGVVVETGDGGLRVSWKAAAAAAGTAGLAGYQVLCSPAPASPRPAAYEICAEAVPASGAGGAGGAAGSFSLLDETLICSALVPDGETSVRVGGLENGRRYDVAVVAVGADGAPSAPSATAQGTPGPTLGFGEIYTESGGTAGSGCAVGGGRGARFAASGLALAVLVVAALACARRRRRGLRRSGIALVLAATLPAAVARAGEGSGPPPAVRAAEPVRPAAGSPRSWNIELRAGPYLPAVDSEFADRGSPARPFAETFSTARHAMIQVEIDRHLLHTRAGTVAVGLGVGRYGVSARALAADHVTRTGDETALRIVPLSVSAVFRADAFHRDRGFPLVPYAKAGLDCAFWSISHSARTSTTDGSTLGWHGAAGISLDLGHLDPDAARLLDQDMGVNQAAIFIEGAHYVLDGLGTGPALRVGDTTWFAGLMLEV